MSSDIEPIPSDAELAADDAFLTALAEGKVTAGAGNYGTDAALAEMFSSLADEIAADLPPVPELPADFGQFHNPGSIPATTLNDDTGNSVVPLYRRMIPGRFASAGLGAAAAAVVFAGGVGVVNNAEPGSALWPLRQQVQGDQSVAVQLASTLDEADAAADSGDTEKAERLLSHARVLLEQVRAEDRALLEERMEQSRQKVRTVVVTTTVIRDGSTSVVTEPAQSTSTETVTETITETTTPPEEPAAEPESPATAEPSAPLSSTRTIPPRPTDVIEDATTKKSGQSRTQSSPTGVPTSVPTYSSPVKAPSVDAADPGRAH